MTDYSRTVFHEHLRVPSMDPTSFLCDYCEDIWPCETMAYRQQRDRLAEAIAKMPDAGLAEGDPRYEWWWNVMVPALDAIKE